MSDSNKASKAAASAPAATVDINALQTQAQNIAQQNAANSAALENQYNPGASQLRSGSLQALMASLGNGDPQTKAIADMIASQAGSTPLNGVSIGASSFGPASVTAQSYDSALTRDAIARAQSDLALGGALPQDVRNLVARNALARSGSVTGGLGLGRDITARDLGLTSLQLQQQRLSNALNAGSAEASLGQGNASLAQQAALANAGFQQGAASQNSSQQQAANIANAQLQYQNALAGQNNLFNSGSFLNSINSGNFAQMLAAAQLGQNIAQPQSGLDPGSVANLAVGNSNAVANQAQNAAAIKAQSGNQLAGLGGNLLGIGLGAYNKPATTPYTPPAGAPSYYGGGAVGNFGFN